MLDNSSDRVKPNVYVFPNTLHEAVTEKVIDEVWRFTSILV